MLLQEVKPILIQINSAKAERIKILHKLIFNSDEVRQNRKNLRQFTGFNFKVGDVDFDSKVVVTIKNFPLAHLTSISNLLF